MSIPLTINGVTYNYPKLGDENWGQDATNWAVGITQLTNTIETILNNTVLSGIFEFGDGSAATPSLRFQNSLFTGLYRVGADILGFTAAGVAAGQISSGGLLQWKDGSAATPAFSFSADPNVGMYRIGADQLGFATAGLVALSIDASQNVNIAGNLVVSGSITLTDLTLTGNTIIGNADTDNVTVNAEFISSLVPDATNTYDFGSTSKRWRDLFSARDAYLARGLFGNGTAALPSISFESDTDTGIYRSGANILALVAAGANRLEATSSAIIGKVPFTAQDGSALAPSFSFENDLNTGVYLNGADTLTLVTGGVGRFQINSSSYIESNIVLAMLNGSATNPAYTFVSDFDTGVYLESANKLSITTGGARRMSISDSRIFLDNPISALNGLVSAPAYSFDNQTTTGMYLESLGVLAFSVAGTKYLELKPTATISRSAQIQAQNGTAGLPSFSFEADANTGLFSVADNRIGVALNGTQQLEFNGSGLQLINSGFIRNTNGTTAAPAYTFTSNTDLGIYRDSGSSMKLVSGGADRLQITNTQVRAYVPLVASAGSSTDPSFSFAGDLDTGLFNTANTINFATGAINNMQLSDLSLSLALPFRAANGSAATPSISFSSDTNTGIYWSSADLMALVSGGAHRLEVTNAGLIGKVPFIGQIGSETNPSFSFEGDTNTGIYSSGANTVDISCDNGSRFQVGTTYIKVQGGNFQLPDGTAATPTLTFFNDVNTGLFRKAADSLGFSANGTEIGSFSSAGAWTLGATGGTAAHVVNGNSFRLNTAAAIGFDQFRDSISATGLTIRNATQGYWLGTAAGNFQLRLTDNVGAVYLSASADGHIGLGGASDNDCRVYVRGNNASTNVTQFGLLVNAVGNSFGTSAFHGIQSQPFTAAVSYVCPLTSAFKASGPSIGSGSSVTRHVNFYSSGISTAATNNAWGCDNTSFIGDWVFNFTSTNPSSFAGPVQFADGTQAAPSFAFNSDTDLGLYRAAANTLAIVANNSQLITFADSEINAKRNLLVYPGSVGSAIQVQIQNNDDTSASSSARLLVDVGGDSAGDPRVTFRLISGALTNWTLGLDNSTSDSFKLSQSSALGANDFFEMSTAGKCTIGVSGSTQQHQVYGKLWTTADSAELRSVSTGANTDSALQLVVNSSATTGDAYALFTDNSSTNSWSIGRDTSDSYKFKISLSNSLGINDYFAISSAGLCTIGSSSSSQIHRVNGQGIQLSSSPIVGPTIMALQGATIADNQVAPAVIFTFAAAANEAIIVHYSLARGTDRETGTLHMVTNGTTAAVSPPVSQAIGTPGVTFSADISGSDVRLLYTSTNTGTAGTIKYWVARWDN